MAARVYLPANVTTYVIGGQSKPRPADGIVQCTTRGELLDMLMQGAETISTSNPRVSPANLTDEQAAAQTAAGISGLPAAVLTESVCAALPALVSADGNVTTSRAALTTDNGATLELADGVTYTLSGSVALPAGVVLMGPASGTATLSCAGGATINDGTSSVSITAGEVWFVVPRRTSATAFVAKGS